MKISDLILEVTTDDGTEKMTIKDYNKSDVRLLFGYQFAPPPERHTVFLGRHLYSFSDKAMKRSKRAVLFEEASTLFRENPLKYFVPQADVALDFLNWRTEKTDRTMKVFQGANGVGKSVLACIDLLLELVPCDPTWPIFTEHGVKYRPYNGPFPIDGAAIVSYEMKNHENTLWPQVLRLWCPQKYILDYITGKKTISWRSSPKLFIEGTPVYFYALNQKQTAFESQALRTIWWDEQGEEDKFNGANARVRRRGGRHICSMTPHKIQGRPDTGAGSYVHRILKGELDVGLDVQFFKCSIETIPDYVMRKEDKEAAVREWIEEPLATGNKKKYSEGLSRVYGEFHEASGLVIEDFDRNIHCIPRFEIPDHWTLYRYHDHGRMEPNACILVAVNEAEEYFIIGEYYEKNVEIADAAKGIIEMCGNARKLISPPPNERYDEIYEGAYIMRTLSDPRSFNKHLDGSQSTIGQLYAKHGLRMQPGSASRPETMVVAVAEMMQSNPERQHFVTKEYGAPGFYVFNDLKNTIWEFENWRMKPFKRVSGNVIISQEKPEAGNDHLMQGVMMLAMDRPHYVPNTNWKHKEEDDEDDEEKPFYDPITGL